MCIRDRDVASNRDHWTHKGTHSTTESTFANHLIEANHTYKNIDNNMNILHVHTKGRKLDTLEQLEIYKHTKTNKNDILNEQTQFKSHALFEPITPHKHNIDLSKVDTIANNKTCLLYTSRCV